MHHSDIETALLRTVMDPQRTNDFGHAQGRSEILRGFSSLANAVGALRRPGVSNMKRNKLVTALVIEVRRPRPRRDARLWVSALLLAFFPTLRWIVCRYADPDNPTDELWGAAVTAFTEAALSQSNVGSSRNAWLDIQCCARRRFRSSMYSPTFLLPLPERAIASPGVYNPELRQILTEERAAFERELEAWPIGTDRLIERIEASGVDLSPRQLCSLAEHLPEADVHRMYDRCRKRKSRSRLRRAANRSDPAVAKGPTRPPDQI